MLIHSGLCGEKIYGGSGGRNHKKDYYYCKSKNHDFKQRNGPSKCKSSYLPKESVENSLTSFIEKRITDQKYLVKLIRAALSGISQADDQSRFYLNEERLKQIESERGRILKLYKKNLYSIERLETEVYQLNKERDALKRELMTLKRNLNFRNKLKLDEIVTDITTTLTEFAYWSPVQKREFLRIQLPEFSITKKGISNFTIRVPNLGNRTDTDSWRPPA